jgi:hypothetical protein
MIHAGGLIRNPEMVKRKLSRISNVGISGSRGSRPRRNDGGFEL